MKQSSSQSCPHHQLLTMSILLPDLKQPQCNSLCFIASRCCFYALLTRLLCTCRLARCLCSVITAEALQEQQVLWLLLLLDVVSTCPAHAAVAALALPLTLSPVGSQQSADGSLAAAEDALLGVWRAIGAWAASADVRGEKALRLGGLCDLVRAYQMLAAAEGLGGTFWQPAKP